MQDRRQTALRHPPTVGEEGQKTGRSLPEPKPRLCKALERCCFPSSCPGALRWLPRRVWEEKCTNALRNGMCVLQEAKLAALASKRWEHQPREQCVQTEAPEAHGPGPSAEPWSSGPMTIRRKWPWLF